MNNKEDKLGLLCVEGVDSKKFLQGQLTCNLDEMISKKLQLGAHCNPQGRIISLFHIFLQDDKYFLLMPLELIPIAIAALKKYAVFFKVNLTDAQDKEIIQQIIPSEIEWKKQNIQQKIPAIYPETSEKFLPHEVNLPELNGVSFNKGCYTGQEIIARMQYKGKLKTHLYLGKTQHPPTRGAEIYSTKGPTGNVVDYIDLGYNNYHLLFTANEKEVNDKMLFLDNEKTLTVEIL